MLAVSALSDKLQADQERTHQALVNTMTSSMTRQMEEQKRAAATYDPRPEIDSKILRAIQLEVRDQLAALKAS